MKTKLFFLTLFLITMSTHSFAQQPAGKQALYPALATTISHLLNDKTPIAPERKTTLDALAAYAKSQFAVGQPVKVTFVCTHNSRRSQIAQTWFQAAAAYYGVKNVEAYSGGTDVTAFNIRAADALARAGFRVVRGPGENPKYELFISKEGAPIVAYSKVYDDAANPHAQFAAVMVCSDADKKCPSVRGAALRVSLPTEDPKSADGTPTEKQRYDETVQLLGREMLYVMQQVVSK